ncbi:TIGR03571 family LLM class oxidoreductase [Actinomadura nitritigenes]|uniref:TIGR03571 family LLM class oxidoreductase n=1 Tax=Actinomadura nitritigenes TaxID=134602 RepID=UPI003687D63E
MTLGIELPLDNDFAHRRETPGVPDLAEHRSRAALAAALGFRTIWLRDVPLWPPRTFGDAGLVFDPIAYLGYLAAATENALLGTAAIALPLRNPILLAKEAATIDALSGGRLLLGVASGDRPIEYPLFGVDFDTRAEAYRRAVQAMRGIWEHAAMAPDSQDKVLPAPVDGTIPLIAVGRGGQSTEWAAEHMDAYMTYPRPCDAMRGVVFEWDCATPGTRKPVITTTLVDLAENPDAPAEPIRFGLRGGRNRLGDHLRGLRDTGVAHVALNLRPSRRPIDDVPHEIAEHVLPEFDERSRG